MKSGKKNKNNPKSAEDEGRLLKVCRLLNREHARYIVIGAMALALHGLIRATRDVDLLIPKNVENTRKILKALENLFFGMSGELDAEEVSRKPWTIIGDIPRVDLLTVAAKIKYEEAAKTALQTVIEGVRIPYVDSKTLIKTKNTDRLQDKADVERLMKIHKI